MPRRASPTVKYFQRRLNAPERDILLTAGSGDISDGFMQVLDIYRHLFINGYRPWMPVEALQVTLVLALDKDAQNVPLNASEGHDFDGEE